MKNFYQSEELDKSHRTLVGADIATLNRTLFAIDASNTSLATSKPGLRDLAIKHFQQRKHSGRFRNRSVESGFTSLHFTSLHFTTSQHRLKIYLLD